MGALRRVIAGGDVGPRCLEAILQSLLPRYRLVEPADQGVEVGLRGFWQVRSDLGLSVFLSAAY